MTEAQERQVTPLKESFSHVKQDIHTLQQKQEQEARRLSELQKALTNLEAIRASVQKETTTDMKDHITTEQLNAVKARVTDVQTTLKRLHLLEKHIATIDKEKTTQQEFTNETKRIHTILDIKLNQIEDALDELKKENARFLTKEKAKQLLDEMSKEMTELWTEVNSLRTIKDQLTLHKLDEKTAHVEQQHKELTQHLKQMREQLNAHVSKQEFNTFMRELNKELLQAKKHNEDLQKLKVYLAHIRDDFVTADQLNKKIEEFNHSIDQVQKDTNTFRKETIERKEIHKLLGDVRVIAEKKVDALTENFNKRITEFNNTVEAIQRDTNIFRRETAEKRELKQAMDELTKSIDDRFAKMQTYFNKILNELDKNYVAKREHDHLLDLRAREIKANLRVTSAKKSEFALFLGNMFIITGFLALIAGIGLYLMKEFVLTNYFAIGAIIVFMIGIIIRVTNISKKE